MFANKSGGFETDNREREWAEREKSQLEPSWDSKGWTELALDIIFGEKWNPSRKPERRSERRSQQSHESRPVILEIFRWLCVQECVRVGSNSSSRASSLFMIRIWLSRNVKMIAVCALLVSLKFQFNLPPFMLSVLSRSSSLLSPNSFTRSSVISTVGFLFLKNKSIDAR